MPPLFLLPLLFIGATASDSSGFYANAFANVLRNAIEHKIQDHLEQSISRIFVFVGCKKNYLKEQAVAMLGSLDQLDFEIKSSHYNNFQNIEFVMAVNGLAAPFEATFVIDSSNGNYQLISGQRSSCMKGFLTAHTDSAEAIGKSFIAAIISNSQNKVKLAGLLSDSFWFYACGLKYNKDKAIGAFSDSASELTVNFVSARYFQKGGVEVIANIIRHGISYKTKITLHKDNAVYILYEVFVLECPARRSLAANDGSEPVSKSFISQLDGAIRSHDRDRIDGLNQGQW